MAVGLRFEFRGLNRVRNSLRKLASEHQDITDATVKDWTGEQRAGLKGFGYPPQTNNPQPFKTDLQRRWFWWAFNTGVIDVPYQRTGTLANSWRVTKSGASHYLLENSANYASWVVGNPEQQAVYHQNNWWNAERILREEVGDLTQVLTEELIELAEDM